MHHENIVSRTQDAQVKQSHWTQWIEHSASFVGIKCINRNISNNRIDGLEQFISNFFFYYFQYFICMYMYLYHCFLIKNWDTCMPTDLHLPEPVWVEGDAGAGVVTTWGGGAVHLWHGAVLSLHNINALPLNLIRWHQGVRASLLSALLQCIWVMEYLWLWLYKGWHECLLSFI